MSEVRQAAEQLRDENILDATGWDSIDALVDYVEVVLSSYASEATATHNSELESLREAMKRGDVVVTQCNSCNEAVAIIDGCNPFCDSCIGKGLDTDDTKLTPEDWKALNDVNLSAVFAGAEIEKLRERVKELEASIAELSGQILAIPCKKSDEDFSLWAQGYKNGHEDALQSATEVVAEHLGAMAKLKSN